MRYLTLLPIAALAAFPHLPADAAPLPIVAQNRSSYKIVIPQNAPTSVRTAAKELQDNLQRATGVALTLQEDSAAVTAPYISLGATKQAQTANVLQRQIAEEGFSILNRDGNLYIWGPDTADGKVTAQGGTSNGTANGIYSFQEDYLDVRWLLPGEIGRDVPRRDSLTVPDIDRTEAPGFLNRREPYMQNGMPAVTCWEAQQKLGFSFRIEHRHNFHIVEPEKHKTHPEWFPMINGQRPYPVGRYKLETTNPEVVRFFADRAIAELKADPTVGTFSLSPSDSRGWSTSPESLALYDPAPEGSNYPSTTPLILKFYRDVAEIVKKEYPQGRLAGYIYADYLFPPTKGGMSLPDNFYPVVAPSINYGYTLYREDVQNQFRDLMGKWSKVTQNLFYYDLPNTVGPSGGALLPAAPEILNTIFPILIENKVKGVYIYGTDSWNNAGMANYILAKMMWNPKLDAVVLQREWLHRAYGPQAGAAMEKYYAHLDDIYRDYYRNNKVSYVLTEGMWKDLIAPNFPALEKLFLEAKAQPMTEPQRARLTLYEDNFIISLWMLQSKKYIAADYKSAFQRNPQDVVKLVFSQGSDYEPFPGLVNLGPKPKPEKVKLAPALPGAEKPKPVQVRGKSSLLMMSATGGTVTIMPRRATGGVPFVSYAVKDQENKRVAAGVLTSGKAVTFEAKANTPYYLYIPSGVTEVEVRGAASAYQTDVDARRIHLIGKEATFYYHVPANTQSWELTLSSESPGETAKVVVTAPNGSKTEFDTTAIKAKSLKLDGQEGFWKVEVLKAATGTLDDVYLTFDPAIPQWVSVDPAQPLIVY